MKKRIIAVFHPQAWQNDYAVDVDPEGPVEFDVTDEVMRAGKEVSLTWVDDDYTTDALRTIESAPQWIQDWSGPFWVEVKDAIHEFWEENNG